MTSLTEECIVNWYNSEIICPVIPKNIFDAVHKKYYKYHGFGYDGLDCVIVYPRKIYVRFCADNKKYYLLHNNENILYLSKCLHVRKNKNYQYYFSNLQCWELYIKNYTLLEYYFYFIYGNDYI